MHINLLALEGALQAVPTRRDPAVPLDYSMSAWYVATWNSWRMGYVAEGIS